MDPSQKLLAAITSFEKFVQYIQENSFTSIVIAIVVLLSPFIVRAVLRLAWQAFYFLCKLLFKDQLLTWLRKKISSLLQRFVDKDLIITDNINHQSNLITLYGLEWRLERLHVIMNKVEIRADLGATARKYFKNWLAHYFNHSDYDEVQRRLLANSIKDIHISGVKGDYEVLPPASYQLLEAARNRAQVVYGKVENLCDFNLHVSVDNAELLIHFAGEQFRLQSASGVFENILNDGGAHSNLRFVCIYDGENISLNSEDGNLEKFHLIASDIYLSGRVWRALQRFYGDALKDMSINDGKLMDVRADFDLSSGSPLLSGFSAKVDEVNFAWGAHLVEDLEISLVSKDMQHFNLKKLRTTCDDVFYEARGEGVLEGKRLHSDCLYIRKGSIPFICRNAWFDLASHEKGGRVMPKIVEDATDWCSKLFDSIKSKLPVSV